MLLEEMKNIIKYVIELDITYLETFLGYEGDKVLKVTTKSSDVSKLIEAYVQNLGLNCKTEFELSHKEYRTFVGVEDASVYKLKT